MMRKSLLRRMVMMMVVITMVMVFLNVVTVMSLRRLNLFLELYSNRIPLQRYIWKLLLSWLVRDGYQFVHTLDNIKSLIYELSRIQIRHANDSMIICWISML